MSEEAAFLRAVEESPDDPTLRLVFADWLEERGDPRASAIRAEAARLAEAQQRAEEEAQEQQAAVKRQERLVRLERRSYWGIGVGAVVFYLASSFALAALANYLHGRLPGALYLVRPGVHEWFLYPTLVSLFGAVVVAPTIWRALARLLGLGSVAGPNQPPTRAERIVRGLAALTALFWACIIVVRLDAYTVFGEDRMFINYQSTLGRVEERPYTDVQGLYLISPAQSVKGKGGPDYVILFADGSVWTTHDGSMVAPPATAHDVIRHVGAKTGLEVEEVASLRDVPR